jgi:formate/nitrite transporter FocA (FNT family)
LDEVYLDYVSSSLSSFLTAIAYFLYYNIFLFIGLLVICGFDYIIGVFFFYTTFCSSSSEEVSELLIFLRIYYGFLVGGFFFLSLSESLEEVSTGEAGVTVANTVDGSLLF